MSGRCARDAAGGDVGYSPSNDHAAIDAGRATFLHAASITPDALTLGRQTHGTRVQPVVQSDRGRGRPPSFDAFPETDGMVTACPDVALGVVVADCVPVLLYDPCNHAVGLLHAGWRGTVGGIARVGVDAMRDEFGSRPEELMVGLGPSIGPCCYEVGLDVIDAWHQAGVSNASRAVFRDAESYHFDLWGANRLMLLDAGVERRNIEVAAICTRCEHNRFFSYRAARAGQSPHGRMLMVAQLGRRP
jgi:hypothetical protein